MVKRLIWKEAIRSWPLLVLGLLLPVLSFGGLLPKQRVIVNGIYYQGKHDEWLVMATLGLLMLAVTAWSVMTAASERYRASYLGVHFPVSPALAPVIGFCLQLLLGAVIGLCAGLWFRPYGPLLPVAVMLFVACGAGVSFLLTMAISPSAGFAAGVFWMLGYIVKFSETLAQAANLRNPAIPLGTEVVQNSWPALLAFAVALTILLLPGRLGRRARQIASCAVLAGVLLGFPIVKPMLDSRRHASNEYFIPGGSQRITTPDGALAIAYLDPVVPLNSTSPFRLRLELTDYPRQWTAETTFDAPVLPVGFAGHDAVILAEQRVGEQQITLLRWDRFSDAPRPLFSFTAQRGALLRKRQTLDTYVTSMISSDGRYGLLALPSLFSEYYVTDIWLLDLAQNRAQLVIPAIFFYNASVGWQEQKAMLMMENGNQYQIDLPGGKVERTRIEEERR